ncbi:hypothetical protein BAMY6614_03485 [Bacillus amyloliquefaciens UMAF6614]|nr:hypothetical protein BAMY6614_03485 [Bacillus amyloliquefaciens UMAF6614]
MKYQKAIKIIAFTYDQPKTKKDLLFKNQADVLLGKT